MSFRRLMVVFAVLAVPAACTTFGDDPVTPPPDAGGATDGQGADGAASDGGAADAPPVACTNTRVVTITSTMDAPIGSGSPNQRRGVDSSICNTIVGACVLGFGLGPDEKAAFQDGRVQSLVLTLTRAATHSECGDAGCVPPTYRAAGTMLVQPLRPEWDEATVTWNERKAATPWGTPGATKLGEDILGEAGQLAVGETEMAAAVPLNPTLWTGAFVGDTVAVRVTFGEIGGVRPFVAVLRENLNGVSPAIPPSLTVRYCPP